MNKFEYISFFEYSTVYYLHSLILGNFMAVQQSYFVVILVEEEAAEELGKEDAQLISRVLVPALN